MVTQILHKPNGNLAGQAASTMSKPPREGKSSCKCRLYSPARMFFGGHRFVMLGGIEQETWKTLEMIQHSLGLGHGCCPERVPTGILFAPRSFIKWSETKSVKLGYGCSFRVWGLALLFGKKEIHSDSFATPLLFPLIYLGTGKLIR